MKGDDQDDIPDFLDLKKTLPPDELQRRKEGAKRPPARAKAPDRIPVPPASAIQERQKEKSRVRIEKLRAKQKGETAKMPASGRAALALINQAEQESPVRTQETEVTKPLKPAKVARPKAKPVAKVAKVAKVPPTRGKMGIGAMAKALILDGVDSETVLAKVKKAFPEGATNAANISWYRMDLRRKGLLADTKVGAAAAKKLQKTAARTAKKTSKKTKVAN